MQKLKKISLSLVAMLLVIVSLGSCRTSYSTMSGSLEDESYVVVRVGRTWANRYVNVFVDDAPAVKVRAVTERNTVIRGRRVVVSPGKHSVVVKDVKTGEVLAREKIFVSSRNTAFITVK